MPKNLQQEPRKVYSRGYFGADERIMTEDEDENLLRDVSLFDLIASFKFAIERMPKKFVHDIVKLNVSIDEQVEYILEYFSRRSEATFYDLIKDMQEKIRVVVTFMALLELIRARKVIVRQPDSFGELSIIRNIN